MEGGWAENSPSIHSAYQVTKLMTSGTAGVSTQVFCFLIQYFSLHQLTFLDPLVDLAYPVVGTDLCYISPLGNVGAQSSHLGTSQLEFVVRSACSHGKVYNQRLVNSPP